LHRIVSSLFKEAEKEKKDKATCIELVCIVSDSETALYSEENPNIVILPNVQYYQCHNEWRNIAHNTVHIHTYKSTLQGVAANVVTSWFGLKIDTLCSESLGKTVVLIPRSTKERFYRALEKA